MIFRGLLRFRARAVLYLLVERFSRAGGHVPVLERRKPSVAHSPGDCQARARVLPQALGRTPGPRSCGADCRAPKTNPPAQLPVRISLTRWEPGAAHAGSLQGRREARRARSSEVRSEDLRSTYATRMLRQGFDVRTVQHWMGAQVARNDDALSGSRYRRSWQAGPSNDAQASSQERYSQEISGTRNTFVSQRTTRRRAYVRSAGPGGPHCDLRPSMMCERKAAEWSIGAPNKAI